MKQTVLAGIAALLAAGLGAAALLPVNRVQPATSVRAAEPAAADLMTARPCPADKRCVQTWTLTSRLGHILEAYEAVLGARNAAYRILGIEFTTTNRPKIWYPDFGSGPRHVIVQLTESARQDHSLALFQLGHEAFHLIEPIKPNGKGSYFEEGLASYFAVDYMKRERIALREGLLWEERYRVAYQMVERIAALHQDFNARLKRFRELNHRFSEITADEIRAAFPATPAAIAVELAKPFGVDTSAQK